MEILLFLKKGKAKAWFLDPLCTFLSCFAVEKRNRVLLLTRQSEMAVSNREVPRTVNCGVARNLKFTAAVQLLLS